MAPIHQLLPHDHSYDPETIRVSTSAFEDAWQSLQATGARFENEEEARVLLAKCILHVAKLGTRNLRELRDDALAYLAQQARH